MSQEKAVAMFCLILPDKVLHISALLAAKRFRDKGNKDGAVKAIKMLESAGLGTVRVQTAKGNIYSKISNTMHEVFGSK